MRKDCFQNMQYSHVQQVEANCHLRWGILAQHITGYHIGERRVRRGRAGCIVADLQAVVTGGVLGKKKRRMVGTMVFYVRVR